MLKEYTKGNDLIPLSLSPQSVMREKEFFFYWATEPKNIALFLSLTSIKRFPKWGRAVMIFVPF